MCCAYFPALHFFSFFCFLRVCFCVRSSLGVTHRSALAPHPPPLLLGAITPGAPINTVAPRNHGRARKYGRRRRSPRRVGRSPRRAGGSPRRAGGSPRRSGGSPRRVGGTPLHVTTIPCARPTFQRHVRLPATSWTYTPSWTYFPTCDVTVHTCCVAAHT